MKTKQILIVALSLVLTVCMSIPSNADILSSSKVTATIDKQLQTILQDAASAEKIPVDIWLYETSTQQEREQAIFSKIGLNKAVITAAKSNVSAKEVDEYIATERFLYAEEMAEQYAIFKRDYANIEGLQETRKADTRLFYSQYAPVISAELTRAEIKTLAYDSRVQSIDYSPDVKLEAECDVSIPEIQANYIRDTLGYTGNGIRIGLLEAEGLPDETLPYFDRDKIFYEDDADPEDVNDHATRVAAIMIAQVTNTYRGIVPDAELYATYYSDVGDWRKKVEWLIEKEVHVINMSAGGTPTTYGTREKWLDHVAINHSIHFVKSAGNNNGNVTSPGMAYNIVTVGAIDDNNSTDDDDDERYYAPATNDTPVRGSSYLEADGLTNKPDLVAPGVSIATAAGTRTGTSLAAPHVTAVIAQLCQRKPELKLLQDAMKAILTASVSHSEIRYDSEYAAGTSADITAEYNKFGAGVVNARSSFSTIIESRYESGSFAANSGDGTQVMYTFNVTNTEKIVRVSLSWLKNSVFPDDEDVDHETDTPETASLANLNLYVYDSAGEIVHSNNNKGLNTEIVEFRPRRTGTHRIYIRQSSDSNKRVYYGVAWWHPMSS